MAARFERKIMILMISDSRSGFILVLLTWLYQASKIIMSLHNSSSVEKIIFKYGQWGGRVEEIQL